MPCFLYVSFTIGRRGNHCSLCSAEEGISLFTSKSFVLEKRGTLCKGSEALSGKLQVKNLSLNVFKTRQTSLQ